MNEARTQAFCTQIKKSSLPTELEYADFSLELKKGIKLSKKNGERNTC